MYSLCGFVVGICYGGRTEMRDCIRCGEKVPSGEALCIDCLMEDDLDYAIEHMGDEEGC